MSGTSMASPVVAGVAALVWSQHPEYTNDEVANKLYETADDLGDPGKDIHYGFGRVDAMKALGIRNLAAPVVADISEYATEVTGTYNDMVEKGSVVVSNATEVIGTGDVQSNSTFSVVIPKQKPGTKLTVKVVDMDHNESPLVSINVLDMPPSKPTVNEVTDADLAIAGTAEPGTYLHIIRSDGSGYIGLTQASATGDFRLSLAAPLKANLAFYVVARDATGRTSDKVEATVQDVTPPAAPTVYSISDADDTVIGNAEAWTDLYIRNVQGDVVGEGTVDTDYGNFSIALYERQTAGSILSITVKDKAGFESPATVIRVDDRTPPNKPEVKPLGSSDTSITGKTEQIIKVAVYANGLKLGEAMSDGNGYFSIPMGKQAEGTEIRVTATDAAGYTSDTTVITIYDNTGPVVPIVDEVGDSDTFITGKTEPYAKVEAIAEGKTISHEIADDKGNYRLSITKLIAGQYIRVFATDQAGNSSGEIGVFVKDHTAPQVTGVVDHGAYNQDVTLAFDEGVSKLNGVTIPSGTVVTGEGTYVLVVTDDAGNHVNLTFVIDKTTPDVTGVADGAYYDADQTVKFNEGTATLNGKAFSSGTVVGLEGEYYLLVTDAVGNKAYVNFTIDKSAPDVTGVSNQASYNTEVTLHFTEGKAKLNGVTVVDGTVVRTEGKYTLIVQDQAGNQTTVHFTIDKKAPIVSGVTNNAYYNKDVTVSFDEGKAKLNGVTAADGTVVRTERKYTLIVQDQAGNQTTVYFTIDKKAPIVSSVTNNAYYNKDVTVSFDEGKAKLNGVTAADGTVVRTDGKYTLIVQDQAGNQTTVHFIIDKKAPIVSGVTNNAYYNKDVTVSFDEGVAIINGHALNSGTSVISPGVYTLEVMDHAGNQKMVKFTIDKTAPKVRGVVNNGSYNKEMKVTFNEGKATLNGKAFVGGTLVKMAGVYTLVVTDLADNKTTVKFTIDNTAPKVTGVGNNTFYNRDIKINFNEGKARLNGKAFANGTVVRSAGGVYTLVVTDSAGNQTMVKFTIDKTPPAAQIVYPVKSTATTVSGTDEAYSDITIKVGTKTIGTATTDKYGKFKVTIPRQKKKTVLYVTAKDRAGNSSKTTKVIVY
jgi:hypothetical protein